jgi:hypothetical protein
VVVRVCSSHDELDVPVEAAGVRHLGWSAANESDDHVQLNYEPYNHPLESDVCLC